jgi:exosome complex component RRP42
MVIEPGKKVFVVFVDIYVLNHDGNLIDASALAAVAALTNTKMPNYEVEDGEVKIKTGYSPLPLNAHPITETVAKINGKLFVDPWIEEEQVMEARMSMAINDDAIFALYRRVVRVLHAATDFRSHEDCTGKGC